MDSVIPTCASLKSTSTQPLTTAEQPLSYDRAHIRVPNARADIPLTCLGNYESRDGIGLVALQVNRPVTYWHWHLILLTCLGYTQDSAILKTLRHPK